MLKPIERIAGFNSGSPINGTPGSRYTSVDDALSDSMAVLDGFRGWYSRHSGKGHIRVTSPGMLDISEHLSNQFMLGLLGQRYFIGVPQSELHWFLGTPWIHAAVRPGHSGLSLVCGKFVAGSHAMEPFALNFDLVSSSVVKSLANYHYLDVRAIVDTGDSSQSAVSKQSLLTIEVVPVDGDRAFATFFNGRSSASFLSKTSLRKTSR